jgi:hypothetical protein
MRHRLVRAAVSLSALLASIVALSGCAGSGGDGNQNFTTFQQTAFIDITRSGIADSFGFSSTSTIATGDQGVPSARVEPQAAVIPQGIGGASVRGFVSFPLSLPPGAFLVDATLELTPETYFSTPPNSEFTTLGNVLVDHFDEGAGLDGTDYAGAPLQSNIGTLLSSEVFGPVQMDVTSSVANDLANSRVRSEYRIRFATPTDGDSFDDGVTFGTAFSKGGEPRLIITYAFVGPGVPYLPVGDSPE